MSYRSGGVSGPVQTTKQRSVRGKREPSRPLASQSASRPCENHRWLGDLGVLGRPAALSFDDLRRLKYYLLTARALADPRESVALSDEEIRTNVSLDELVTIAGDLLQSLQRLAEPLLSFDVPDAPICERKRCRASIDSLTPMQVRVLALVATGKMNKQIAWELGISEQTVKGHVSTILKRLGARTRTHAASIASAQAIIFR